MQYRVYLSDALQMIARNTAQISGGRYPSERYADLVEKAKKPKDTRTGEQIAADIIKGLFKKE